MPARPFATPPCPSPPEGWRLHAAVNSVDTHDAANIAAWSTAASAFKNIVVTALVASRRCLSIETLPVGAGVTAPCMGAVFPRFARNRLVSVIAMFTIAIDVTAIRPMSPISLTSRSPTETRLRASPIEPLPWDSPRKRRTSPHGPVAALSARTIGGLGMSNGSDGRRSYAAGGASERPAPPSRRPPGPGLAPPQPAAPPASPSAVSPNVTGLPCSCCWRRRAASNRVPTPRTWTARSIRLSIAEGDTLNRAAISFEL